VKSTRHRTIQRDRHEAVKANALPEWYQARRTNAAIMRAREAAQIASGDPEAPPPPPARASRPATPPPDFAVRTLEATAWSEEDRYPRWLLETCSAGSRLRVSHNYPNI
jgi:hypothetical protein